MSATFSQNAAASVVFLCSTYPTTLTVLKVGLLHEGEASRNNSRGNYSVIQPSGEGPYLMNWD